MIKLSERLQIIADRIEPAETMADIGTDHGFLPVFLRESGRCSKVIMTDISFPSLEKARANASRCSAQVQKGIEFRAGDGLHVISPGEVNAVVISGMGGKLIRDIMSSDMDITCSVNKFVLQPRIGQGHLRRWLCMNGFIITNEDLVTEGDYIPEIITALTPDELSSYADDMYKGYEERMMAASGDDIIWKIPPWIIRASGPVEQFLIRNINKEKKKLENVMLAKTRKLELEEKIKCDIKYLESLVEELNNG